MNVGFIGLGKLGLPAALAMESKGHHVIGYDISDKVKHIIETKTIPYREEGAQELLEKSKIRLATHEEIVKTSDLIFVPVQTPHDPRYEGITRLPTERKDFDYSFLKQAIKTLSAEIEKQKKPTIVIVISTVIPGTMEREIKPLLNKYVKLCYNPYFIAMGTCIRDFLYPEFILFGVDDPEAVDKAKQFYRTLVDAPFYEVRIVDAEAIKVLYNTFISMKLSFMGTALELCHKSGAHIDHVIGGLKLAKKRIVSPAYLDGGMPDGGGCHPRDNIALSKVVQDLGLHFDFFEANMLVREHQLDWFADMMGQVNLPKAILGKSYKPESNLEVGSPAIFLKNILVERGHTVAQYDPHVDGENSMAKQVMENKPHVFFIGTMHNEFKNFKFPEGSVVLDPFGIIPKPDLKKNYYKVIHIGREGKPMR